MSLEMNDMNGEFPAMLVPGHSCLLSASWADVVEGEEYRMNTAWSPGLHQVQALTVTELSRK